MDWYSVFVIGHTPPFMIMLQREFTLWIGAAIWMFTSVVVIDMRTITLRLNRTYASYASELDYSIYANFIEKFYISDCFVEGLISV